MQKLINHYNFFCPTIHSSSYHTKTTVRPSAIELGKVAKKQGCPSHYQGRISTKNRCFKFNYSLLCLVFGGKCKMWPRDIVSPCVTSAVGSHALAVKLHTNVWWKRKLLLSPLPHLHMEGTHREPKGKAGFGNRVKRTENVRWKLSFNDGGLYMFWARIRNMNKN